MPVWPELVVDAFVPAADGVHTRTLYEDDGLSAAHEKGVCALSEITLRRQGDEVVLAIAAVRSDASVLPRSRTVAVRFHLPEGWVPAAGGFKTIPPHASRAADLFAGAEAPAMGGEGPVVLIRAEMDPSKPVTVRLTTKPG